MKSAKANFLKTLNLEKTERISCAPHWWGTYKYEVSGYDFRKDAWSDGKTLSRVYADFYEKFRPDWFHLHIGTPTYFKNSEIFESDGKFYLSVDPTNRSVKKEDRYFSVNSKDDEEIVDFPDYLLGSRVNKPKVDLGGRKKIDAFIQRYIHMSAGEIIAMGYVDHVVRIVEMYGEEVLVAVHIPSAICEIFDPHTGYVGFESGLLAFHDNPEGMRYLIEQCYEEQLEWVRAFAEAGAHAFIISESYISPDIAGPQIYRDFLKPVHRDYFQEVSNTGMLPICNFWGDVMPVLEDMKEINIKALMVEESKKSFTLDIGRILQSVVDELAVFGNLDSLTLLHDGSPGMIRKEVIRQKARSSGNFIAANGSPITPGTPEENVKAMITAAKEEITQ
jgi:hypothetical protein